MFEPTPTSCTCILCTCRAAIRPSKLGEYLTVLLDLVVRDFAPVLEILEARRPDERGKLLMRISSSPHPVVSVSAETATGRAA